MNQTDPRPGSAAGSIASAFGIVISLVLIIGSIALLPHDDVVTTVCRWAPCPSWLTPASVVQLLKVTLGVGILGLLLCAVGMIRSRR